MPANGARDSRFLRACRREPVDATPIWLMRQAGRFMPEYRALRQHWGILDIIRNPELAASVTMQPVNAFEVDAAIIFADILTILEPMGLCLEFVHGDGPVIRNPIRTSDDVHALQSVPAEEGLPFTLEAIRLVRAELDARGIPVIGFSGAPYTLASYAIEGGSSRTHSQVKQMFMGQPDVWHPLMHLFSTAVGEYLLAQAHAGAQALQVFDSWCGELSPADYAASVLPHTRHAIQIAKGAGVPVILFGVGASGLLELMATSGADVIGVDWRIELDTAWERIGTDKGIQGNLDPASLLAPWQAVQARVDHMLNSASGQPGHIFNLGHGVLPATPVDQVRRLVDYVHAASAR